MNGYVRTEFHVLADDVENWGSTMFAMLAPEVVKRAGDDNAQKHYIETVALGVLGVSAGLAMKLRVSGDQFEDLQRSKKTTLAMKSDNSVSSEKATLRPVDGGENE